uniref:Sushi domain-containing protein n=1 Tax=Canis lupus dingo TaxID=286419 RepID=A0A8C0KW06_CANLU
MHDSIPHILGSYQYGVRSHNCAEGFGINGPAFVKYLGEKWSHPPECINIVKCGPPPPIANGEIISLPLPVYAPGSSVEYQCQALYTLRGNRNIICSNGQWSEAPKCLGKYLIKCGPPLLIAKGDITSFPLSVYALYVLWGNRNIVCSNGQWSESLKCLGKYFNILIDIGKISIMNMMFCYL